jgi:acyl-CoA thioesterase FadM
MNTYIRSYCITGSDIDIEYRIHHNAVITFFQDCVANYLTSKQLAAFDIIHDDMMWIISDFNVEFHNEKPFWSEPIRVEVWMSEITGIRFYMDFKLFDSTQMIFAKGNSCWNIINAKTKKLVLSEHFMSKFELCEELVLGKHKKMVFSTGTEKIMTYSHKINSTDLDFNRHVSNRNYLTIASATSDVEYIATHKLLSLSVKFIKESFLNDELICELYAGANTPDRFVHIIKRNADQAEICKISTTWTEKKTLKTIQDYMTETRKKQPSF